MKKPSRALLPFLPIVIGLAGCDKILPPPKPEEVPPVLKLPKTEVFSPDDYVIHGTLAKGTFRVTAVPAGDLVTVQTVAKSVDKYNRPTVAYGTTETVHLSGIITQTSGKPGYAQTIQTISNWTMGLDAFGKTKDDLTMEVDLRYPWDENGRRMVQLYFTPKAGPYANKPLNLNRMLVRSGYAVVDLHQATSVDLAGWLNDEVYARNHRTIDGRPDPLGLWKMGVLLGQRPAPSYSMATPTPMPKAAAVSSSPDDPDSPRAPGVPGLPGGSAPGGPAVPGGRPSPGNVP